MWQESHVQMPEVKKFKDIIKEKTWNFFLGIVSLDLARDILGKGSDPKLEVTGFEELTDKMINQEFLLWFPIRINWDP